MPMAMVCRFDCDGPHCRESFIATTGVSNPARAEALTAGWTFLRWRPETRGGTRKLYLCAAHRAWRPSGQILLVSTALGRIYDQ